MAKWIVIAALAFGGYQLYLNGYIPGFKAGAFDDNGHAIARVFVAPGCGQLCDDVTALLESHGIEHEQVDISTSEGQGFGVRRVPLTQIGDDEVLGNALDDIVSALAQNYGEGVLTPAERRAMRNHFDEGRRPLVVMYATQWCPYCKRQREYFADNGIDYVEVDVEASTEGRAAYDALHGGGYPLTYVGYRRFPGYKEGDLKRAASERL